MSRWAGVRADDDVIFGFWHRLLYLRCEICYLQSPPASAGAVRFPSLDDVLRKLPMLQALDDPIEVMILGFEFPDRISRMRGDEDLFSGLVEHGDLNVTEGFRRHVVFELIEQFDVFVRQLENRAPGLLARGRYDAGEAAPPLGRPAAELDAVVGERGQHLELVFGRPSFELSRMEINGRKKELSRCCGASILPWKC